MYKALNSAVPLTAVNPVSSMRKDGQNVYCSIRNSLNFMIGNLLNELRYIHRKEYGAIKNNNVDLRKHGYYTL